MSRLRKVDSATGIRHCSAVLPGQTGRVASEQEEPGFVTIVRSRYGGAYEPGKWIAFPMWPDELPSEWNADDVTCMNWFRDRNGEFGGGDSPQEAYEDLL